MVVPGDRFIVDASAHYHEAARPGAESITVPVEVVGGPNDGIVGHLHAVRTRDGRVTFPGLMGLASRAPGPWHTPMRVCRQRDGNAWALHEVGARLCVCPEGDPAPDPAAPAGSELGHVLEWAPLAASGDVERWVCPCSAYVMRAGERVYGSATVTPCHLADERLDRALAAATGPYAAALRALVTVRSEHRPDGAGGCVRCAATSWPCTSRTAVATAVPTAEGARP
ncbi:hypothetical protein ACFCZ3_20000 [Cellulosimicrobium cellulans]|uniref:hypothetical protein n=1 Tax=Cellulosimicrobium cellulans TaxID=1710 RepID=UPI0035DFEA45